MSAPAVLARPVIAVTAVAAPVASALAVASFHTHTSDPSRQLDLIKANVAGFTGMILLEHLTWVCIAVACVAVAVRIAGRGAWPAAIGAFTLVGLLLTFVALWRARLIHVAYLGVFLLGAALLSFAGGNPIAMLGSFAVLAVAMFQITRLLLRPTGMPDEIVLPEHDHVAA